MSTTPGAVPDKEGAKEMEIHVKRTREPTKGLPWGKDWKFSSIICANLMFRHKEKGGNHAILVT